MGDEAQKRNTDCVYFLASPLTCKKGADCEYRHSEAARVNPRDCWYWLSGNCLNASCSFRHPPLDGRPGVSVSNPSQVAGGTSSAATTTVATTAAAAPSIPSTSTTVSASSRTSKSTVPCYFFSQGYCAKGVKCSFSHGPSTQFRKEATTYLRPHVNEPPANGEGNGVSHAKQQSQDRKPGAQIRPSIRAAIPSPEAGYFPSNVYKLSASGVLPPPSGKHFFGNTGERLEQTSQVGGLKPVHNIDDTTRNAQVVENRISQAHFSSECMDQFPTSEKGSTKGQLSHLDLARTTRQSRQPSAMYVARTSNILPGSEIQDPFYELEGQLSARELHANDLRNHLKRKKSDIAYSGQLRDFRTKEFSKDRVIVGRLASRAVSVAESKDFVPVNSKRARQEKESSTFSGPKSLAQIKAEKSKAVTQGSSKAEDSMDDCKTVELDPGELKGGEESASKLPGSLLPKSCKEPQGDHQDTQFEETKSEQKNVSSEHEGTNQELRPGVGINDSNGLSSEIVPLGVSKEAEVAINHSSEMHFAYISKTRHSLGNEETLGGKKRALHTAEGTRSETDIVPADELMEDGSEALENAADTEYASEYDEEDDFHKRLGSFLS